VIEAVRQRATEILVERRLCRRARIMACAWGALGVVVGVLIESAAAPLAILCAVGAGVAYRLAR
jgi:hypothetical protein